MSFQEENKENQDQMARQGKTVPPEKMVPMDPLGKQRRFELAMFLLVKLLLLKTAERKMLQF